jgi:hypothetical protein
VGLFIVVIVFTCNSLVMDVASGAAMVEQQPGTLPAVAVRMLEALATSQQHQVVLHVAVAPESPVASDYLLLRPPVPPPSHAPPLVCVLSGLPPIGGPFSLTELAMARLLLRETLRVCGWNAALLPLLALGAPVHTLRWITNHLPYRGIGVEPVDPPG